MRLLRWLTKFNRLNECGHRRRRFDLCLYFRLIGFSALENNIFIFLPQTSQAPRQKKLSQFFSNLRILYPPKNFYRKHLLGVDFFCISGRFFGGVHNKNIYFFTSQRRLYYVSKIILSATVPLSNHYIARLYCYITCYFFRREASLWTYLSFTHSGSHYSITFLFALWFPKYSIIIYGRLWFK